MTMSGAVLGFRVEGRGVSGSCPAP